MAVAWKDREALHQPEWPDRARLEEVKRKLHALPPLVFAGEARQVRAALAEVAAGRAFLLQAGDCAESFHDYEKLTDTGAAYAAHRRARVQEGGLPRPAAGAPRDQGLRPRLAAGPPLRAARVRDRARARVHARVRDRPGGDAAAASGRRLDEPRGPAARLRGD